MYQKTDAGFPKSANVRILPIRNVVAILAPRSRETRSSPASPNVNSCFILTFSRFSGPRLGGAFVPAIPTPFAHWSWWNPMALTRFIPSLPKLRLPSVFGFFSSLSVRTRILLIALVPVIGLFINGFAFMSGQTDVEAAFEAAKRATALAEAAREYKVGVTTIRSSAREYATRPSPELIKAFNEGHALALKNLDTIQKSIDPDQARLIVPLRRMMTDIKDSFDDLIKAQKTMGIEQK